jgi:anti-sigma B factor antagonist
MAVMGRSMPGLQVPQIEQQHGVTVVTYGTDCERITEDRIPEILQALLAAVDAPHPRLLIDLSTVSFFGSSFIEVLFRVWNRVQQQAGGRFALCGLTPNCAEVIEVTNLDRLWEIYPNRDAAMAAFTSDA